MTAPERDELPAGSKDWRENFANLAPDIAASPLPSRQLRRSTARQIAKGIATVKKARPNRRLKARHVGI